MMQMGRYHYPLLLVLLMGLAACGGTSSAGLLPGPVWHPEISDVKAPSGSLNHGESVSFEVTWTGGRAPFRLEWDFVGGAKPGIVTATEPALSTHSVTVTLHNEGPEETTFTGRIYLKDVSENTASKAFSFTVSPPPPPDPPPAEDPDDGTDPPGDGTDPPGDGTDPPDDGTDPPGDGTDPPDDGTDPPDDGTDPPDDGTDPPDDDPGPPPIIIHPPPPIL